MVFSASILLLAAQAARPDWDPATAARETTPTRERICLNGLWRWQPAAGEAVPDDGWGFFKVPGFWPGGSGYDREDSLTVHPHPKWKDADLRRLDAAWYERTIDVPAGWAGRRIALSADAVSASSLVFVDGARTGEIRWPGGEVDLTAACRPGARHRLSMLVSAKDLQRRGLCGDLFLVGMPPGTRLGDLRIETSVSRGEITFDAALLDPSPEARYVLRARITPGPEFKSPPLQPKDGRLSFTAAWRAPALWDLHTPQNLFTAGLTLEDAGGRALDVAFPERFGFREFRIDGRDFLLNGTRLFLSAVPLDNAQVGVRTASYAAARETMRRLQGFGINFVYTHNYGCEPGSHVGFEEILRAADDAGMLVALSQPHFSRYDWKGANDYARDAAHYVRVARNHPSVVAYVMSHNATGYDEDMNPDLIDGRYEPRDQRGRREARRAEEIVRRLDPSRLVYHHSSGNLGSMHTSNFYANFVPVQELCDWFEHWADRGVKPLFPVEFGVPFSWDWTMYRGWYQGERQWGSAKVPWEYCLAEWNAQFLGDRAYRLTEAERRNVRWEAAQFKAGKVWHRWDYPTPPGSPIFEEQQAIYAMYLTDAWRAHRTWGISANSPWEYGMFWKLRDGADRGRREFAADVSQRPGFHPDFFERRTAQMATDLEAADWVPTAAGEALMRNNRPLLAWIGGPAKSFTARDHTFFPGEKVEKQLIVVNNSRRSVACKAEGSFGPTRTFTVETGAIEKIPFVFAPPAAPGAYTIDATVTFDGGEVQKDAFVVHVVVRPPAVRAGAKIALYDPKGETARLLERLQVPFDRVEASADLGGTDVLVVGKGALTGAGPDVGRVRDGLRVVLFEQSAAVLQDRFGFRTAEIGLRRVFRRVPDHPLLAGLAEEQWRDWRGEATLSPGRLEYALRPRYGPTVQWCGIEVPRAWRCGNRGSVASVVIEKPAKGDFLPILDAGYALQYSPLLEYREGKGMVLFCQVDVTGRTQEEPAARTLARNIIDYAAAWKPGPVRRAWYAGEAAGRRHLESAGFVLEADPVPGGLLIAGPGAEREAGEWLKAGGPLLGIGLEGSGRTAGEYISAYFEPAGAGSPLAGVGPADAHNRDPRELPLIAGGVLAVEGNANFCQLAPWRFDPAKAMNQKRTFRRVSFLVTRLAANLGAPMAVPILRRFKEPPDGGKRWLDGLYLDVPEEWDDPYRFFRW